MPGIVWMVATEPRQATWRKGRREELISNRLLWVPIGPHLSCDGHTWVSADHLTGQSEADEWYAAEVERIRERAPA